MACAPALLESWGEEAPAARGGSRHNPPPSRADLLLAAAARNPLKCRSRSSRSPAARPASPPHRQAGRTGRTANPGARGAAGGERGGQTRRSTWCWGWTEGSGAFPVGGGLKGFETGCDVTNSCQEALPVFAASLPARY